MKPLYTLIFFLDSLVLIALSFSLFYMLDKNNNAMYISLIVFGIFVCINILVILLFKYLNLPQQENKQQIQE